MKVAKYTVERVPDKNDKDYFHMGTVGAEVSVDMKKINPTFCCGDILRAQQC